MANIIGEPLKKYVASQINIRQKAHGSGTPDNPRSAEYMSYLNSKTAWVKLASGIQLTPERVKEEKIREGLAWSTLAKNYVLAGGISALKDGYLKQRGTYSDANNVFDYIKGTYNVQGTATSNDKTGEYGLAPMPGITGVEIKCLTRGSLKRAEVNIKCYTPEQFQILDLLYLRLGYTMFLEWGWSPYLANDGSLVSNYTTLIEAEGGFFNSKWKKKSYSAFLPAIEAYRKGKKGNYDGLLCKVTNFSWTFAQDGSYDITLSLLSLGDVVESLKANVTPSSKMSEFINQSYILYNEEEGTDQDIVPTPSDNIISSYLFIQKLYLDPETNEETGIEDRGDIENCTVYSTWGEEKERIPLAGWFITPPEDGVLELQPVIEQHNADNEKEAKEWLKTAANGAYKDYKKVDDSDDLSDSETNCYYSDGEGYIMVKSIPSIELEDTNQGKKDVVYLNYNNGEDDSSYINDNGFYMRLGHLLEYVRNFVIPKIKGTKTPIIDIDYGQWSNLMYTVPYQVSFDPRVCIVNGGEKVNTKDFFPTLEGWKEEGNGYAWVMNIYVNHNQILQSLNNNADEKGNVAVFDFLQNLCDAINRAMGGVNNLEVVLDEEINMLKIIDGSYAKEIKKDYGLELYGYNPEFKSSNFVRSFNLKTEITNDFATMATIGSTAGGYVKGTENTMFSKWNNGIIDRWKEKIVPGDKNSQEEEGEVAEPNKEYVNNIWSKVIQAFGYTKMELADWFSDDTCGLNDEIIDKNVAIATEFFRYCQSHLHKEKETYGSPTAGFVPINLSVTMEGLSGIKIYNALNVETRFLPQKYPKALKFIVKGVNHSIKDNDWETTIETVTIAQNQE
jgi:hypothetical protein